MRKLEIQTSHRAELVDITDRVRDAVADSGIDEGVAHLWSFHTTCGLTVNEGADPAVARDILARLQELAPRDHPEYRHAEGNSDSHIKTSLLDPGAIVPVTGGELALGTWQAIFLAEFDGPRMRTVGVQVVAAAG